MATGICGARHATDRLAAVAHPGAGGRRVKTIRVQPLSEVPTIECVVVDDSGEAITFVFLGRRSIAGLRSGTQMIAEGMIGKHKGKLAMINPSYEVFSSGSGDENA